MKTIQVIGGGFAGLSVAYFLKRAGHEVRLVERDLRMGGLLRTLETPQGLVETAANAMLSNALVERTAEELGIELVPTLPSAKARYIYRRGRMHRWPLSVAGSARLAPTFARYFLSKPSLAPLAGESVSEWGTRNLGPEGLNYLLAPALSGIYAGQPKELSASLVLGRFFRKGAKAEPGKLRGSVAPKQGMGAWAEAFRRVLPKPFSEAEEGLPTVVALPPHRAAEFLRDRSPELSAALGQVPMLSLLTVTVFLPAEAPGIEGFGCLFPRGEGFRVLGILANDRIFPNRVQPGFRSETWIFGGALDPEIMRFSDDALRALILEERARLFEGKPVEFSIHRWPSAIPYYSWQLEKLLPQLTPPPGGTYSLFGTYQGDLGLARVLARAEALSRSFS